MLPMSSRTSTTSAARPRPTFRRLGEQLNVHPEALRNCVRQAEVDAGERHDRPTIDMLAGT